MIKDLPYPLNSPLEIWQAAREMNSFEFKKYYTELINKNSVGIKKKKIKSQASPKTITNINLQY